MTPNYSSRSLPESNHSPHVKKGFVKMISDRISDLSSNEDIFNAVAPLYNSALRNSGFNENIKFTKDRPRRRNRKRKRGMVMMENLTHVKNWNLKKKAKIGWN